MGKRYFSIEHIIELIKKQRPERLEVIKELEKKAGQMWQVKAYVRFVSAEKANQAGSEWQFSESIELKHETEGAIVLDILEDGRIGGIEFIDQIKD